MRYNTEEEYALLANMLPPVEASLLDWAINLMADVVEHETCNKMNARNIAMVFAPNMTQMADPLTAFIHAIQVMNFLKTLILKTVKEREEAATAARAFPVYFFKGARSGSTIDPEVRNSDRFGEDRVVHQKTEIPNSQRRFYSARRRAEEMGEMNWVSKKIHLYNVTMGLYMLDWWERCLFNILVLILLWFICFNGSRFVTDVYESHLKDRIMHGGNYGMGIGMPSS